MSPDDKVAIVTAFSGLLDDMAGDVDEALEAVERRLLELHGECDFYSSPLREAWDVQDSEASSEGAGLSPLAALLHKRQIILYGPPGTGKTYDAKQLADRLIRYEAAKRWGISAYLKGRERLGEVVRSQVRRRQLHGGYSYEDFVVGLRVAENGETEPYRGDLLQLIDEMRATRVTSPDPAPLPWVLILDEINRTDLSRLLGEAFSALDDRGTAIDLPSVGGHRVEALQLPADLYLVGTMNLIDQSVEQFDFALRRRFLWVFSGFRAEIIPRVVGDRWKALEGSGPVWLRGHTWAMVRPDIERLARRAAALNRMITDSPLLGADYELGHTYFFDVASFIANDSRLLLSSASRGEYLWDSTGTPLKPLLDLWRHSLQPLLNEYLSGLDAGARSRQLHELETTFLRSTD